MAEGRQAARLVRDPSRIANEVGRSQAWVTSMLIDRRGRGAGSNMTTIGLQTVVGPGRVHRCTTAGLVATVGGGDDQVDRGPTARPPTRLDEVTSPSPGGRSPRHRLVLATWSAEPDPTDPTVPPRPTSDESVLGPTVRFRLDGPQTELTVPLVDAGEDPDALRWYGAELVRAGQEVVFADAGYPIWVVDYGPEYVDRCLLGEGGGGFYLEWHTDRPHWHQPLSPEAGGFYLLARRYGSPGQPSDYQLTAFSIPTGTAVYTSPGVIHCDAALTGTWAVGYADSQHFSTAMVRNHRGDRVRISAPGGDGDPGRNG